MLHPTDCGPTPASGRLLAEGGEEWVEGIGAPFGEKAFISFQFRAVEAMLVPSMASPLWFLLCPFSSYLSTFVFSLLHQHSGIFERPPLLNQAVFMMLEKQ